MSPNPNEMPPLTKVCSDGEFRNEMNRRSRGFASITTIMIMRRIRERWTKGSRVMLAAIALAGFPLANATELSRRDVLQSGPSAPVLHDQGMALLRQGNANSAVAKLR